MSPARQTGMLCMLCGNVIFMPFFGYAFNGMLGGLGWLIGLLVGFLVTLDITCVVFAKKLDSPSLYGLTFLILNVIVGFIFYSIVYAFTGGNPWPLDTPEAIFQFIGIVFGISIIVLIIAFVLVAMAGF